MNPDSGDDGTFLNGGVTRTNTVLPDGGEREDDEDDESERYELTVAVEGTDGEPIPQANLTIESDEMGIVEGFLDDAEELSTDSSGEATVELENAEYTVDAEVNGEQLDRTVEIDGEDETITLTVDTETNGDEDEESDPKEAEGDVSEDESESHGTERGTTVLYLDLEGLFLDLLGLEVDLHEVTLDVRAIPGGGKLLGNLLSAVAGLLGGGPLSVLLSRLLNTVTGLVSTLVNSLTSPLSVLRSLAGRLGRTLLAPIGWVRSAGRRVWDVLTAPLSWIRERLTGDGSEEGDDESGGDDSESEEGNEDESEESGAVREKVGNVGDRMSDAMPDTDRSSRSLVEKAGHRLGTAVGHWLGDQLTGSSDEESG